MILIQFTGLSGSGKSTLAINVAKLLKEKGHNVEIIDGDVYRSELCMDLGFSKKDRLENIKRLFFVGKTLVKHDVIVLMSAINPYFELRKEIRKNEFVRTVYLKCSLKSLIKNDVKGLYKKALLPLNNPKRIENFTGISAPYEAPLNPDLVIQTDKESIDLSTRRLLDYIIKTITP